MKTSQALRRTAGVEMQTPSQRAAACGRRCARLLLRRVRVASVLAVCWVVFLVQPTQATDSPKPRIPPEAAIPDSAATEGSVVPYAYPPMAASGQLAGKALVDALRLGGYVLYMRHTQTGVVTKECTISNLTPRGTRDAARVGHALRALGIPLGRIVTSPVCRAQDTTRALGVESFEVSDDLAQMPAREGHDFHAGRERLLATPPTPGKNALIVGHLQGGKDSSQALYLDFGEIIVLAPSQASTRVALARVRVDDWAMLVANFAG